MGAVLIQTRTNNPAWEHHQFPRLRVVLAGDRAILVRYTVDATLVAKHRAPA